MRDLVSMTLRLLAASILAAATGAGWAIPALQLTIPGGTYVASGENTIAAGPAFTLVALVDPTGNNGLPVGSSDDYFISVAIVPASTTFSGSFLFEGTVVTGSSMTYGTPSGMSPHGVFPTLYWEHTFQFNTSNKVTGVDVQTCSGATCPVAAPTLDFSCTGAGCFNFAQFSVDATLVPEGFAIHFDLYNKKEGCSERQRGDCVSYELVVDRNAPFSHDSQSYTCSPTDPACLTPFVETPEPGVFALVGAGALGLGLATRRRRRRLDS